MRSAVLVLTALSFTPCLSAVELRPLEFRLTFTPAVSDKPFTGRVFVTLTSRATSQLPRGFSWINPDPIFAIDVKNWRPSEPLIIGRGALAYPTPLAKLKRGTFTVFAVMDFDRGDTRQVFTAEGNGYSSGRRLELDSAATGPVNLVINQVYRARKFQESDRVKLVEIESKLLSRFHGRPVRLRAGVALPKSFATSPHKRYPVVYEIPGFGGTHFGAFGRISATDVAGVEMIYVVLDPDCRWGHHVFADSDNNGPVGHALCEELIPAIEHKFRGIGQPEARFVTGHSSGGWSSLWLQVTYPDFFGSVWSTSPDPVDFRDFQRVNLYQPGANLFTDDLGHLRPLSRGSGASALYFRPFCEMETVMGHGGQLGSFEASFSPRGADGRPRQLWDRTTGRIDAAVAKTWERYDIRLVLERNWATLGPKLARKLHVYTGSEDTYFLEGAVRLLKESLAQLGSGAVVEIVPGRNHGTLRDRKMRERIAREMAAQFRRQVGAK